MNTEIDINPESRIGVVSKDYAYPIPIDLLKDAKDAVAPRAEFVTVRNAGAYTHPLTAFLSTEQLRWIENPLIEIPKSDTLSNQAPVPPWTGGMVGNRKITSAEDGLHLIAKTGSADLDEIRRIFGEWGPVTALRLLKGGCVAQSQGEQREFECNILAMLGDRTRTWSTRFHSAIGENDAAGKFREETRRRVSMQGVGISAPAVDGHKTDVVGKVVLPVVSPRDVGVEKISDYLGFRESLSVKYKQGLDYASYLPVLGNIFVRHALTLI